MRFLRRCPLVSVAALTMYLMVHVFAAALHHHHAAENQPARSETASASGAQLQTTSPAEDDEEKGTCALCSVLHRAQMLPSSFHVEAAAALTGKAFSTATIIRPYPVETATHSRAPPKA